MTTLATIAPGERALMLPDSGFEKHRKATRRDEFLAPKDRVVPWKKLS